MHLYDKCLLALLKKSCSSFLSIISLDEKQLKQYNEDKSLTFKGALIKKNLVKVMKQLSVYGKIMRYFFHPVLLNAGQLKVHAH